MKPPVLSFFSLLFYGATLLAGCGRGEPSRALVAVVVDLSGRGQEQGRQVRDGARLALREARRKPAGASGIELLIQDDRGDPERAARLARYLVGLPEVLAVIGPSDLLTAASALPHYERRRGGVPTLVPGPLAPELTRDRAWVFGMAPAADFLGKTLGWFVVSQLATDSVASFFSPDLYGRSIEEGFFAEVERLGGRALARVPLDPSVAGFGDFVAGARAAPALLVAARAPAAGRLISALREAGVRAPVLASEGPLALEGVYYPLLFDPGARPAARRFADQFARSFGEPAGTPAALAYDAASLVVQGFGAGARDRVALRDWLAAIGQGAPHSGITGTFFFTRDLDAVREVKVGSLGGDGATTRAAR